MASDDPIGTAPLPLSLGKEREQWVKRAWDAIDESKLGELNRTAGVTNVTRTAFCATGWSL